MQKYTSLEEKVTGYLINKVTGYLINNHVFQ